MSEWGWQTLGDIAAEGYGLVDGPFGSNLPASCYVEAGIPVIRGSNLTLGAERFIANEFVYVSEETANRLERSIARPNDIVFTKKGTIGQTGLVPNNLPFDIYLISSNQMKLTVNEALADPTFVYYYVSSKASQSKIKRDSEFTGVPKTNTKYLREFPIYLPPLSQQKQIAQTLDNLDLKIENLRKQNETLEKIAQTLFKHWFVDFEFPFDFAQGKPFDFAQGKPNTDGRPYKSSGGEMVPSEIGEIPAGWRVGKLENFCDIKHGYAFKGEFITTEKTEQILLTPGNFRIGSGFNSSKYKYYVDDDYDKDYVLDSGDLIITMTDLSKEGDTLGYPAFVPRKVGSIFLHNQRLGKVVNNQIDLFFLFFSLCRREYRSHILGSASGSTVRHTSPSRILDYQFVVPDEKLLGQFASVTGSLINKTFANHEQIETLIKTRDALLPKLMSGKLRVGGG
ncbi:MAG: restriction endonuclease subunit S [Leptolyngbya sp. SIO1D8]|nr:restriction endonuclease subunit S [Leptolyngbya sp. SIO1D8]